MTKTIQFKAFEDAKPSRFPNFDYTVIDGTNSQVIISNSGDYFTWIPSGPYIVYSGYDRIYDEFLYNMQFGKKINGFWTNTFSLSKGDNGIFRSVPFAFPYTDASNGEEAKDIAKHFMGGKVISICKYKRILTWLIEIGEATKEQIYVDSTSIGLFNSPSICKTASHPELMMGNLDCFAGNTRCWVKTKDKSYNKYYVAGGDYIESGKEYPIGTFWESYLVSAYGLSTEVRIVL